MMRPRVLDVMFIGRRQGQAFTVGRQVVGKSLRDTVSCYENIGRVGRSAGWPSVVG